MRKQAIILAYNTLTGWEVHGLPDSEKAVAVAEAFLNSDFCSASAASLSSKLKKEALQYKQGYQDCNPEVGWSLPAKLDLTEDERILLSKITEDFK